MHTGEKPDMSSRTDSNFLICPMNIKHWKHCSALAPNDTMHLQSVNISSIFTLSLFKNLFLQNPGCQTDYDSDSLRVCLVRLLWALCVCVLLCLATNLFMRMCLCTQLHNELTQPPLWRSPSGSMCLQGNTSCQIFPEPPSWSPSRWQRMRRWNCQSPAEEDAYIKITLVAR